MKFPGLVAGTIALAFAGWITGQHLRSGPGGAASRGGTSSRERESSTRAASPSKPVDKGLPVPQQVDELLKFGREQYSLTELSMRLFEAAGQMSNEDLKAAIAAFAQSRDSFAKSSALYLIGLWAERDLAAAQKWLAGVGQANWAEYAAAVSATWSRTDPRGLLNWFKDLPESQRAALAPKISGDLAAVMGKSDPDGGLALFAALPAGAQNADDYKAFFGAWTAHSPSQAAAKALTLPAGAMRSAAVEAIALSWVQSDPGAARAWIDTLPDAALVGRAQAAYAVGLCERDPKAAAEYVADLPPTVPNLQAMDKIADRWVRRDSDAALTWSDGITDETMRSKLQNAMIEVLASTDPEKAAQAFIARASTIKADIGGPSSMSTVARTMFATGGIDSLNKFGTQLPPDLREFAFASGFQQWTVKDPAAMAAWALQQPDGPIRSLATRQLAISKYRDDPASAIAYVKSLPPGKAADGALMSVAGSLFRTDLPQSTALFQRVGDQTAVQDNLVGHLTAWIQRDPGKAQAFLNQTSLLTSESKARVMKAHELFEWAKKRGVTP